MFSGEEREFTLENWYMTQQQFKEQDSSSMDYVQKSIVYDVDEPAISSSLSSASTEGAEVAQGPRKISPRPWLMAPKNLAISKMVVLPVTVVTGAALLFYTRDSISAGAAKFDVMRLEDSQDSVRKFMLNAKSSVADKFLSTRFPSSTSRFAHLHGANPSWDRVL